MKGYIYKYTFSDGKVYIGQTRRPQMRDKEHFYEKIGKLNSLFWGAYEKLGKPQYEIIDTIEAERPQDLVAALNEAEKEYIYQYDATNPEHGYNVRKGGNVAIPRDKILDAEFERIWDEYNGEWKSIYDDVLTKCFKTFEPLTDSELEFCKTEFADEDNIFSSALLRFKFDFNNLKGNSEDSRFWLGECADFALWRFQEELTCSICHYIQQNREQILKEHSPETTILQIDMKGKIVREYSSPQEIREALQRDNLTNIYNVLEGKQKSAYGFVWCYKKDYGNTNEKEENGQLNIIFDN